MLRHGDALQRLVLVTLAACGHAGAPTSHATRSAPATPSDAARSPADADERIGIALTVTPSEADVSIDGVSYGRASTIAPVVELKPGLYTMVVKSAGYVSYRVEFSVADKIEVFAVHLERAK